MKLQEIIVDLRSRGYEVDIRHERCTDEEIESVLLERQHGDPLAFPQTLPPSKIRDNGNVISPFGGKTTCKITSGDKVVAQATAHCAPIDQFKRHEGSIKALGRAISELGRNVAT